MYEYKAKIVRIIDADTFVLDIDLGFHTHRIETVRIMNYDAPEIRLYEGVTQEEKELGIKAKTYAQELLPQGTEIFLKTYYDKTGKYGRFLGDVFYSYDDLNQKFRKKYSLHMKKKGFIKS